MKRFALACVAALIGLTAAACSDNNKRTETPAVLDVKMEIPDHIELNKPTKLACVVTYGGEKVDDASEVKFEVWKHGAGDRDMLEAKRDGSGRYSVTKTFTEAGTYSVVAHVTARDMHNMPKKDVVVGNPSQAAEKGESDSHASGEADHQHGEAGHHHDNSVSMSLSSHSVTAGKPVTLAVRIMKDGKPLTKATVRFEIWQADNKHEFVETKEAGNGDYQAEVTFATPGTYSVKVHVEAASLHEHQVEQVMAH
ncbi:FixH family protein [Geobacillus sp. YF-1]|uniref:FixH family protein n=1 Tax=Geobacillus sp. YF-1 TaxID=3457480 RepID=UPI004045494B